ncbi:MAG: alpha/beta hydrolase [Weeksellaceae bacterium]|jgi:pimeloyl-ACP methyl ester carboxylesterase|nr:alpha/beta hydrolase [Weeksellaceae bacterium]MDX9704344.1 alpha/beta hydrolase [Weeksellaceae bacterium]
MLNFKVEGKGNPVVLIHGYLENMQMWEDYAKQLSKDFQVIRMDLPGHGDSAVLNEIHSMELVAREIKEVLDFLKITKTLVVGHSMGGYVSLALTELFPEKVKALVLMNSSSLADSEEKKELRLRAIEMADKNQETLVKMSIPLLFNEHKLEELKTEREFAKKMALETSLKGVKSALRGMRIRPDRTFILHDFSGEIKIILGKYDRTVPAENFKKEIPNRENISVLELECGHMAYLEEPEKTLESLKQFAIKVFS